MSTLRISVIDSHTAGEPTRVVIAGGPPLGTGSMAERLEQLRRDHDSFRSAVVSEPRGSDVLVGALLCSPNDPACAAGVLFFNNVGYLGMCGHGAIGLVATLAHLGRIGSGVHRLDTPVGTVSATLNADRSVSVVNVPSYRKAKGVTVDVAGLGKVTGDVAWGGNWFFLVKQPLWQLDPAHVIELIEKTWKIRQAMAAQGFPEIDHVELFGPPRGAGHARNFVLCPGKAYDRSPCGTGTSAKLACLAADADLAQHQAWIQECIIGSTLQGSYRWLDRAQGTISPTITGSAFITAETTLLLVENDPFRWGIR